MCSDPLCSGPFILQILGRDGQAALPPGTVQGAAASSPIRLEAVRYSLAMRRECSYPPIKAPPGSRSTKDFQHAQNSMLRPRAPMIVICLPAPLARASGENSLLHRPQRQPQRRSQVQLFFRQLHQPLPQVRPQRRHRQLALQQRLLQPQVRRHRRRPSISRRECEFRPAIMLALAASSSRVLLFLRPRAQGRVANVCFFGPLDLP